MKLYQMYRKSFCIVTSLCGFACTEVRTVIVEEELTHAVQQAVLNVQKVSIPLPEPDFQMGNHGLIDERPVHTVILTQTFQTMKTEVTQGLYEIVMGDNPSFFDGCGPECPVEKVRWIDAVTFSNRLNEALGLEPCYIIGTNGHVQWPLGKLCAGWRLPTEAEWEWMAQPSTLDERQLLDDVAWYKGNSSHRTHTVCKKSENSFGLCDTLGNVQEWVWDIVEKYPTESVQDPMGGVEGSHHIYRGGAWNRYSENVVHTKRKDGSYIFRNNDLGFRLVQSVGLDQ